MSEDPGAEVRDAALAGIPGATSNESSVAGTPDPPLPSTGDRNFVTGDVGSQPVLASEAVVTEPEAEAEAKAPPQSASKAEWVEHAVDKGMPQDEAEAKTKADLIEDFG